MVDKTEEAIEEIILEDLDISDIEFYDRSLDEWEDHLTVVIPSLPCTGHNIASCLIDLGNKYQESYNAYNKLLVLCSRSEKAYVQERDRLIAEKVKGLTVKPPSKETLECIVLSNNKKLQQLKQRHEIYQAIKVFFENNKTKLEKLMNTVKDISYHVNFSDKMNHNGRAGNGS